ncbi:MAG TPA: acyltransferase [Stellaceae bacterium]|nr:acyltransferase [Stellaceae bacterium]
MAIVAAPEVAQPQGDSVPRRDIAAPAVAASTIAPAKSGRPKQLDALTGLRFFAAFAILFAHDCDWVAPFKDNNIIPYYGQVTSIYGMPLFFVLSGFVIHYNYGHLFGRMRFRWAALEFFGARFARLYPLFIACFAVGLVVDVTYTWLESDHPRWWIEMVAHFLTMTQSWFYIIIFDDRLMMDNAYGLAWSISTEFFFYLCYMGLVFFILQLRRRHITVIALMLFALLALGFFIFMKLHIGRFLGIAEHHIDNFISVEHRWNSSFERWFFYYSPYCRIFEFIMGCLTAHLYLQTQERSISHREHGWSRVALGAAILSLIAIGWLFLDERSFPKIHDYVRFLSLNFICAVPIAVLIFCVSRYDTRISRFLGVAWLVALGEVSYSIYSVHTWTLRIFIRDPVNVSDAGVIDAVARIALGIAVTLILATATYRFIEVPGRARLRRVFQHAAVALFGLRANNFRGRTPNAISGVLATGSLVLFLAVCLSYQLTR